ncbi:hypothetical protein V495_02545 [Pseudogymnoascus sp. VKM F-4514 (FW-929)]|nr:hypothetical protein V495_02545 [Pseudogymnoascus sp. VKM F-4514 (FW-929)]KFY54842.1 hypothetical protein V497_07417 [Pseudogymnoascus sp. VKM F-4516 (FW-969)]
MSSLWTHRDDSLSLITDTDAYSDTDTDTIIGTESRMDATFREESAIGVCPVSRSGEVNEPWDLDGTNTERDESIRVVWHCFILDWVYFGIFALCLVILFYGDDIVLSLQQGASKVVLVVVSYADATALSLRQGAGSITVLVASYYGDAAGRV